MNRFQFLKATKSALLYTSVAGALAFDTADRPPASAPKKPTDLFPDKDNYLVEAICYFRTPKNRPGKHKDKSYVNTYVDIDCYDFLYSGEGLFGDGTEMGDAYTLPMPIIFSPTDQRKIFFNGIKNFSVVILGNKPDATSDAMINKHDYWVLRWEFMMRFAKGNILSTGYTDPAYEYHFGRDQSLINNPVINGQKKFFTIGIDRFQDHVTINQSS
jgi:hypothetical protein